jgi:plasmid maintenance system antidote protein VapI
MSKSPITSDSCTRKPNQSDVNEKRGITADTAARLGCYFGTSLQYWLNIPNRFNLDSLDKAGIKRDVIPKKAA